MKSWHDRIVTQDGQMRMLDEILGVYQQMHIDVRWEMRNVSLHDLIATQNGIEADKLELVIELFRDGRLEIPIIVEEHFVDDRYKRYLLDGHCRTRARIEAGVLRSQAYLIWSPAGDFPSNFVTTAARYGNQLVRDLPLI